MVEPKQELNSVSLILLRAFDSGEAGASLRRGGVQCQRAAIPFNCFGVPCLALTRAADSPVRVHVLKQDFAFEIPRVHCCARRRVQSGEQLLIVAQDLTKIDPSAFGQKTIENSKWIGLIGLVEAAVELGSDVCDRPIQICINQRFKIVLLSIVVIERDLQLRVAFL